MNFVADENVDQPIVTKLRAAGHTVLAIGEMEPSISDEAVLNLTNGQEMVLLTGDKDFGELVYRDRRYAFGIVHYPDGTAKTLRETDTLSGESVVPGFSCPVQEIFS